MKKLIIFVCCFAFANAEFFIHEGKKVDIQKIENQSRSFENVDYYKTKNGVILGVNDEVIVKFKDIDLLGKVLLKYNLKIAKKIQENSFLLKTTNKNLSLNIANELSNESYIQYAYPNFVKTIKNR